ncbi:hypothetical protein F0562_002128 [Nyssa sinensis]|uniref:RING-type E3 ubiquitin transferase n=1 Tax=Nyssa sinensis TaxID=561372 RepID=A0A5J5C6I7_9ASTE|nr:hypothetical protein F0562_002128 [Nyssa sinensis]
MAPTNGSKTSSSYAGSDSNFDSNMVIILAALLCALICALGLNSIVRCAIRCGHRFAFETPHQAVARLASTGLKKDALSQIPVAVYKSGLNIPATDCPICLGEFAEGEKVRILPRYYAYQASVAENIDVDTANGANIGVRNPRAAATSSCLLVWTHGSHACATHDAYIIISHPTPDCMSEPSYDVPPGTICMTAMMMVATGGQQNILRAAAVMMLTPR